ncbi:hypothetical protein ATANTOWER_003723 [Ataeniobius toweri]|uniref:Alpha-2-macroglobulin bait region domain-containing protein n=1 Tax=Ataeniobius toweri TaxID=208326 RepID=A0ABU7A488_9TELE|nr:hypothetical protein [Ataeniobius toweri]
MTFMDHLLIQMWTRALCVFLCGISVGRGSAEPHFMVAIPAVLESGAETKFCASLKEHNETLLMRVTLVSQHINTTLLEKTSTAEFNECFKFQVPLVQNEEVQSFEVEVRGDTFLSKQARKVMIKAYKPRTFIQTDKPIYLPGQTVHFRVVSLDSKLRSASRLYNIIELEDPNSNRIGQWLNETSNSKILQLSYTINSEAREGSYKIMVQMGDDKEYHSFKVEKYVLPKFDVTINVKEEVCIWKGEFDAEICAKYTYGQPVPGSIRVHVCQLPQQNYGSRNSQKISPCDTQTKQTDKRGCGTLTFNMTIFNHNKRLLLLALDLKAVVEEEGTGVSQSQGKRIKITNVAGKLSFVDTPRFYKSGSNVEGKVKAVDYDDRPIPHMKLQLFKGLRHMELFVQNLTTDSHGVAVFSISTDTFHGEIRLVGYAVDSSGSNIPDYKVEELLLSELLPPSLDTKSVSSLELKKNNTPLSCDEENDITVQYTIVKEAQGTVEVIYLVLSRGAIIMQEQNQVVLQDKSVNKGEVSFKLRVSADMAPDVQVVAYAVLPSENVIAHSSDFKTEKCFNNKVSLEFSPSSAVPGEETKLQLTAQPDSLCGVSAIDQSVLIKEPGKSLNDDKIFNLLPIKRASTVPHHIEDTTECLHVRPKRFLSPSPRGQDAYTVFKIGGGCDAF